MWASPVGNRDNGHPSWWRCWRWCWRCWWCISYSQGILNPFFREIDLHLFYFWFPEFFCFWLGLFSPKGVNCGDGLIIPIWKPYDILTGGERFGRGVLYIILMVWLFIGVSIVSDRFMESIEMITAQEKEVTLKDPKTGRNQTVIVKVSCIKRIPNK